MQNIFSSQPFMVTTAVFLTAAGSFAGLALKDRRPRDSLNPSLVPTTPLMLVAGIIALLSLVVLLNLLKLQPGTTL
jgi:hypothetical protein